VRKILAAVAVLGMTGNVSPAEHRPSKLLSFTPWLVETVKGFERLSLTAYRDAGRYHAIGYGHRVGPHGPTRCTRAQAERWLRADLRWFHEVVTKTVTIPMSQGQHDALVSFAFNIGPVAFRQSSAVKYLNRRDYKRCAVEMLRYVKSQGKVSRGLVLRRQKEVDKFLEGVK